jgi:hypothetical protein
MVHAHASLADVTLFDTSALGTQVPVHRQRTHKAAAHTPAAAAAAAAATTDTLLLL